MNILFVAPRIHTNMYEIINGLTDHGHRIYFYTYLKDNINNSFIVKNIVFHKSIISILRHWFAYSFIGSQQANDEKYKRFIPSIIEILFHLIKDKPDLVIVRDENWFSMTALIVCKFLNINPVIKYSQVPLYYKLMPSIAENRGANIGTCKLKSFLYSSVTPRISYTPVESRDALDFFENKADYIKKKNKYFVPLVAKPSINDIPSRKYCPNGKIRVINVGKYRPYKNHELFINAATKLSKDLFEFTIIGQCVSKKEIEYYEQLLKYIESHQLNDTVSLIRNVSFIEMENIYLNSDVLILSSLNETAAVCILEAMCHGVIPISPDTNGTASYIKNNETGYIYRAGNLNELVEKLKLISDNLGNIQTLGQSSYRYNKEFYSFDAFYKNFGEMLFKEFGLEL